MPLRGYKPLRIVAPEEILSHPSLSLHFLETAYQISGRNFFQVGDDVTTRDFKAFALRTTCFTILFLQFILRYILCMISV
ncbi:hypothetical protein Hanom_Chr12g01140311 [Helianthus anomalus]